jgi:hypothetical protein
MKKRSKKYTSFQKKFVKIKGKVKSSSGVSAPSSVVNLPKEIDVEDYKLIPLTQGQFAMVSPEDFEELSKNEWYFHKGYAVRSVPGSGVKMHRQILNAPKGVFVDHINRNGLDNRRSNLRLATPHQSSCNVVRKNGSNQYRGVYYEEKAWGKKRWVAQVKTGLRYLYRDRFETELEAAQAYNLVAKKHFGEFAILNDVPEGNIDVSKPQLRSNNTSGFRGVHRENKSFVAQIKVNRKTIRVGLLETPELAARAYDEAAIKFHGTRARLNFPSGDS